MSYPWKCALAVALFSAAQLMAQVGVSTATPVVAQTVTSTGMVGLAPNQTAQLNVVNLAPAVTTTSPVASCSVELAFYDAKGTLLKSSSVSPTASASSGWVALLPGMATSAKLDSSFTSRTEIRGVVTTLAAPVASNTASTVVVGGCSPMTTLEIFDAAATHVFTSDTRTVSSSGSVTPLTAK
jgi:hypothetical protein